MAQVRRVLVTGAAGQIGAELVRGFAAAGADVHGSDLHALTAPLAGVERLRWHELDVADAGAVRTLIAEVQPDLVVHLAAILSARGEEQPELTWRVNMGGLRNVLEACRQAHVPQLLWASTIAVYGPGLPSPVAEDVPLLPTTLYGVTKAAGEMLGGWYARRYGLDFRVLRLPGLISASEPGGGSSDYALYMYWDGIRRGAYTAFCRPDTRIPLMYMDDAIRAFIELARAKRERLTRHVYNIQGFSPAAEDIAAAVRAAVPGVAIGYEPCPRRQPILDSWPDALDDDAARRDWGWSPRYDLQAMTADLVPRIRALQSHA